MERPYQGWGVTFASMIALSLGAVALLSYVQSIFAGPVLQEYPFSRGFYFGMYSIGGIVQALLAPLVGRAADKWGVRPVLLLGTFAFGLSVSALGFLNGSPTQYAVLTILTGAFAIFASPPIYSRIVSSWMDRKRGLALAVALTGSGIGGFIIPRLATLLIQDYGWREARIALGLAHIVILMPLIYFFVFEPRDKGVVNIERAKAAEIGIDVRAALTSWVFWALCAVEFFSGGAVNSMMVNFVLVAQSRGFALDVAAAALSWVALSQLAGRFISGGLLDAIRSPKAGIVLLISGMIGIACVFLTNSPLMLTIGALFIGAGLGAELELAAYYTSRYFGVKNFATINGCVFAAFNIGGAIGITGMSIGFDRFQNYNLAFITGEISLAIGVLAILILPKYVFLPPPKKKA